MTVAKRYRPLRRRKNLDCTDARGIDTHSQSLTHQAALSLIWKRQNPKNGIVSRLTLPVHFVHLRSLLLLFHLSLPVRDLSDNPGLTGTIPQEIESLKLNSL
ncbi:hypothetical protein PIB30_068545 [Stylosanthes scabra]|uniref:Uncharacterized protein n=1 Tax=Stylosanthes scabra TaxID=79078 RepID=A0ABU6XN71_9FABA|nr:hypothetical protein [Stylosanthes scabra]